MHTTSSWLVAAGSFPEGFCLCFSVCVIKKIRTNRKGFSLQEVRSDSLDSLFSFIKLLGS